MRARIVTYAVLYLIGLGYVVGFISLFSASLNRLSVPALLIGPFWEALMLVPLTLALAAMGVRAYQFLLSLASYEIVASYTWYHFTGEWKNDVAEGAIPIVATMGLVSLVVQVPIGITASYVTRRIRHRVLRRTSFEVNVPGWVVFTSIISTVIIILGPMVWIARETWPNNLVAKAVYWARPTPPPLQYFVRSVRYRPEALAIGEGHTLFVSSDGPNAVVVYRVLPAGGLALWHALYGPHTGIRDPLGVALDKNNRLYVSNYDTSTIGQFKKDDSGDVAPQVVIEGPRTLLDHPSDIQIDNFGFLYVLQGVSKGEILIFAPGANGNVKPLRVISGPHTLLSYSAPMRVDALGTIFVGNYGAIGADSTEVEYVTIFAKLANGDVAPSTILNLRDKGRSIAVDDAGRMILVASDREILAYPPTYSETNTTSLGFVDDRQNVQQTAVSGNFLYFTDLQDGKIFVYPLPSSKKGN
jgi:hypothetical protein